MDFGLSGGLLVSSDTDIADANREGSDLPTIQSKLTEMEVQLRVLKPWRAIHLMCLEF